MISRRAVPVLAAVLALGVAAPAAAATSTHEAGALTAYTGDDLYGLSTFTDLGALAATDRLTVDLVLKRPDAAGEAAYEKAIYTPGNPRYGRYLTADTFAATFGVSTATYHQALSFATAHGMTLQSTTPAHDTLVLTGTAAQAAATFHTSLERYAVKGSTFFANTTSPMLPAGLPVAGLFGLETMRRAHDDDRTQDLCVKTANQCTGDLTPQDLWSIYDQPSSVTGQGQKMSIFGQGAYDYVIKDLRQFETENNLPQIPVAVVLADGADDGTNYTDTGGDGEWQLDTQSSSGMSPNAKELDLIWGSTYNYTSLYNVLATWVNTKGTSNAASASYSDCEPFPGSASLPAAAQFDVATTDYLDSSEQELTQAVLEGKTLFSSSGDTGGSCAPLPADANGVGSEGTVDVGYPASSPHAVGVGGTVLYGTDPTAPATPTRALEYGWTAGGGGNSNIYSEPAFQKNALGAVTASTQDPDVPCTYDSAGTPDTSGRICRKVPDVSAVSGDLASNGYDIVDDGNDTATGGTSLSSPIELGLWTRIQAASCAVSPAGVSGNGFADYVYYTHAADFFDPGGATASAPSNNEPWVSGPGFDDITGLGVPDVAKFLTAVDASTAPCATAPADQTSFPLITDTTNGVGTPGTALPETAIPAALVVIAAVAGGAVLARRRRRGAV